MPRAGQHAQQPAATGRHVANTDTDTHTHIALSLPPSPFDVMQTALTSVPYVSPHELGPISPEQIAQVLPRPAASQHETEAVLRMVQKRAIPFAEHEKLLFLRHIEFLVYVPGIPCGSYRRVCWEGWGGAFAQRGHGLVGMLGFMHEAARAYEEFLVMQGYSFK